MVQVFQRVQHLAQHILHPLGEKQGMPGWEGRPVLLSGGDIHSSQQDGSVFSPCILRQA